MTWLNSIFHWVYALPPLEAVLLAVGVTVLFLLGKQRFGARWFWNAGVVCLLLVWLVSVLWTTIWGRAADSIQEAVLLPFHSYYTVLTGGNSELLRSNFMNALLFFPAGLLAACLLPARFPLWARLLGICALFAALSIGIELYQYTQQIGRTEIDDVLHNTLGALLGGWAAVATIPTNNT